MDFWLRVESQKTVSFLKELEQKLNGTVTLKRVTDYEAAKVLQKAVALTGKADVLKMQSKVGRMRAIRVQGRWVGLYNKKTGQYNRLPNRVWAQVTAQKRILFHRLKIAIGLSKQSWWNMAKKLGYDIEVPGYVTTALPSSGRQNNPNDWVSVKRNVGRNGSYELELWNRMSKIDVPAVNGRRAIFAAIAGRISYFKQNMKRGVFDDAKAVAAKYPGIEVTTTGI